MIVFIYHINRQILTAICQKRYDDTEIPKKCFDSYRTGLLSMSRYHTRLHYVYQHVHCSDASGDGLALDERGHGINLCYVRQQEKGFSDKSAD